MGHGTDPMVAITSTFARLHSTVRHLMGVPEDQPIVMHTSSDPGFDPLPIFGWFSATDTEDLAVGKLGDTSRLEELEILLQQSGAGEHVLPQAGEPSGLRVVHEVLPRRSIRFTADGTWAVLGGSSAG